MKLAWLVYPRDEYVPDDAMEDPDILFDEPYEKYRFKKVVPIVYSEIEDHE